MQFLDALMVLGAACLGGALTWSIPVVWAVWMRRRRDDVRFRQGLAWGGTLTATGEKTGTHALLNDNNPNTVGAIQRRIDASASTGEMPIVERMRVDRARP